MLPCVFMEPEEGRAEMFVIPQKSDLLTVAARGLILTNPFKYAFVAVWDG